MQIVLLKRKLQERCHLTADMLIVVLFHVDDHTTISSRSPYEVAFPRLSPGPLNASIGMYARRVIQIQPFLEHEQCSRDQD
jgi:hypothetical protein